MTGSCSFSFQPGVEQPSTLDQSWSCPHEAIGDADRCLFHLSPRERDARGIDEEMVTDELWSVAEQEGEEKKQVIGAKFGDVDLSRVIVDAPDKYPIDLRHATIDGTLDLSNSEIHQPVDLRDTRLGDLAWAESEFAAELDLVRSVCRGDILAESVTVRGDIDARRTRFEGQVILDEARFGGDSCFRDTKFCERVQLRGCEFHGEANLLDDDACFEGSVFEDDVAFTKAQFRYADFVSARFEGDAGFREVAFEGDAEFRDATFEGRAEFGGAEFHGDANVLIEDADFSDVEFLEAAVFENARFRKAVFSDATFEGEATFTDSVFDGQTVFTHAAFEGAAGFGEARFHDDVAFRAATFARDLTLSGAEFHGGDNADDEDLSFEEATLRGTFEADQIEVTQATFEGAIFDSLVTFHEGAFAEEVTFTEAVFADDAVFNEVRFGSDVSFERCTFSGTAAFSGAEFQGGNYIEDDDVTFEGATFEEHAKFRSCRFQFANFSDVSVHGPADFTDARFALDAVFSDTQWNGETVFLETRFREDVNFTDVTFAGEAVFRGTEFHGGANTEEDDLAMDGATFEEDADFYRAKFRYANFEEAHFAGKARFTDTVFEDDARFFGCRFEGEVTFDESLFNDDASFRHTTFEAACQFRGAEFHGGANVLDDDVVFSEAVFQADATFSHGEFAYADFSSAVFERSALFEDAVFSDEAVFADLDIGGTAAFERVTFAERVTFHDSEFDGQTRFSQTRFEDEAKFVDTVFRSGVEFTGTAFEGEPTELTDDADFERATFNSPVTFDRAQFRYANFLETTFDDTASFDAVVFEEGAVYDEVKAAGEFRVCHSRFMGDVSLENARFESSATFRGTIFDGGTSGETSAANFDKSEFHSDATFEECEFRTASFIETKFCSDAGFKDARFVQKMSFQAAPKDECALVDMTRAELNVGYIKQPNSGATFYDLTETTVRDITLEANRSDFELLDYFLFVETDFEGFDFSAHMRQLSRNNWNIHSFRYDEVAGDSDRNADQQTSLSMAELERTYLMAKNSADELGHRKAVAEFYIKEFTYRRKKNKRTLLHAGGETGSKKRLIAGGKWFGNLLLYETCGYGERIWRILYVSALVIVTWAILYLTVTEGTRGPGDVTTTGFDSVAQIFSSEGVTTIGHALYFSLVTFTTLGYGDVQPIGPIARLLASFESFLGALLLALVVFVIGRRMA